MTTDDQTLTESVDEMAGEDAPNATTNAVTEPSGGGPDVETSVVPEDLASEPSDGVEIETNESAESTPTVEVSSDPVLESLTRIEAKLAESQRLIGRHADVAAQLHSENQALRAGELRKAQTALVLSVVSVLDDVQRMADTASDDSARSDLKLIAEALVDALDRNGIEVVPVEPGEPFEARRHKVIQVEATADASADRTVARILRPGFAWSEGDALRAAQIVAYKYSGPTTEAPESADASPADETAPSSDDNAPSDQQ